MDDLEQTHLMSQALERDRGQSWSDETVQQILAALQEQIKILQSTPSLTNSEFKAIFRRLAQVRMAFKVCLEADGISPEGYRSIVVGLDEYSDLVMSKEIVG